VNDQKVDVISFAATQAVVFSPAFEAESFAELADRFDHGERPEAWRAAGRFALGHVRDVLGEDWLAEVQRQSKWFPPELGAAYIHTREYARLLELALRLSSFEPTHGIAGVRNALRSDRRPERWVHTLLQLEVASLAVAADAEVRFEARTATGGYPADVLIDRNGVAIPVEVFAVLPSMQWRAAVASSDAIGDRIRAIEQTYGVTCEVDFSNEHLATEVLARFLDDIELGAAVVSSGQPVHVARSGNATAMVRREGESRLVGPPITENPWRRISARVEQKRDQTKGSPDRVWLRVDLLDGTWQFSQWAQASLAAKLEQFSTHIRELLKPETGNVAGVIASSGSALAQGRFSDETIRALDGSSALRRVIAPVRVRETMVIPFGPDALEAGHFLREIYAAEPEWFDGALKAADLNPIADIFPPVLG
jgi:hypothetical protein